MVLVRGDRDLLHRPARRRLGNARRALQHPPRVVLLPSEVLQHRRADPVRHLACLALLLHQIIHVAARRQIRVAQLQRRRVFPRRRALSGAAALRRLRDLQFVRSLARNRRRFRPRQRRFLAFRLRLHRHSTLLLRVVQHGRGLLRHPPAREPRGLHHHVDNRRPSASEAKRGSSLVHVGGEQATDDLEKLRGVFLGLVGGEGEAARDERSRIDLSVDGFEGCREEGQIVHENAQFPHVHLLRNLAVLRVRGAAR